MEQQQLVLEAIQKAGKPLRSGEIEKLTNLSKTEVDKAMKKLKEAELIVSPQRCLWEPKK